MAGEGQTLPKMHWREHCDGGGDVLDQASDSSGFDVLSNGHQLEGTEADGDDARSPTPLTAMNEVDAVDGRSNSSLLPDGARAYLPFHSSRTQLNPALISARPQARMPAVTCERSRDKILDKR